MSGSSDPFAALRASLGRDAAAFLRALTPLPGVVDWLQDEAVVSALVSETGPDTSPPLRTLLAASGIRRLEDLPEPLPPRLAVRRAQILGSPEGNAEPYTGSPQDVLLMTHELVLAADRDGALGALSLLTRPSVDWRAPLACAWSALEPADGLVARIVETHDPRSMTALVAALRSNVGDERTAKALSMTGRGPAVVQALVELGEYRLAESVAGSAESLAKTTPFPDGEGQTLKEALASGWETRRRELAAWADAMANASDESGDWFAATEARRQALQIDPSERRLASLAITHIVQGDASAALALLPSDSDDPELKVASGMAYIAGGALEKGRAPLVEGVTLILREDGVPKFPRTVAASLTQVGEGGLAIEVLRAHLEDNPDDSTARQSLAHALIEFGQPEAALAQIARLTMLEAEPGSDLAQLEARALIQTGDAAKALPALRAAVDPSQVEGWKELASCAIQAGEFSLAEDLLQAPPAGLAPVELDVFRARRQAAAGNTQEAERILQATTLTNPSADFPWLELSSVQDSAGRSAEAGETLRRAVQTVPSSSRLHAAHARWLRVAGRPSEALESAVTASELEPHSADARVEEGLALLALGRPHDAVEPLRQASRTYPGRLEIRLALADALESSGDRTAAAHLLAHLPDSAPAAAWLASGRLALSEPDVPPSAARDATAKILRARSLGGSSPDMDYWLGIGFQASDEPERAAEAFSAFLERSPRDPSLLRRAALGKAACLLSTGHPADSLHDLEVARSRFSGDSDILIALARAYLASALTEEAAQAARSLLQEQPTRRDALDVLTEAAKRSGNWEDAFASLLRAANEVGDDSELWVESAEAAVGASQPSAAEHSVDRALSCHPGPALQRRAALVLVALDQTKKALAILETAAAEAPDDPGAWIEVADVADRAGAKAVSLDALGRAVALQPQDSELQVRRALGLWAAGRHNESIGAWAEALKAHPGNARIHGSFALAMVRNGEVDAGFEEFARALEAHPADAALLTQAGKAHLRSGSPDQAIGLLNRAAQIAPDSPQVNTQLAEAWLRQHNPAMALSALKAISDSGSTPDTVAWALQAEALLSTGDLAGAEESLAQARRRCGAETDDRVALARADLRFGHWQQAVDALGMMAVGGDAVGQEALADAILKGLEARWLFGFAGRAVSHAPSESFPGGAHRSWIETFVSDTRDSDRHLADRLRLAGSDDPDDAALADLLSASAGTDCDPAAREALAIALLRRERPMDALQALKSIDPDDLGPDWQALLAGVAHGLAGNQRLARQAFDDAAQDAGLRPLALALYAQAAVAEDDRTAAISALNQALVQWPDEPIWQSSLAGLYASGGSPDSALPHLQRAAELLPEDGPAQLALAEGLRQAGHMQEALTAYEYTLRLMPEASTVWADAGETAAGAAAFSESEACYARAVELEPDQPVYRLGHARAALALGKTREAARRAEAALKIAGERADCLVCLAEISSREGDHPKAIEQVERAVAVAEDPAGLYRVRSRLLMAAGRPEDAADVLRVYLSQHETDESAWLALGEAVEDAGDLPEAATAFEKAAGLAPRSAQARLGLARVSRKSGQLDRALDELQRAEALDPLDPHVALELGMVHEARRELDQALEAYQRSAEVDSGFADAFRRAGSVLKSLKAYGDAARMLARAAELDPSDPSTLQQLAAVRALELVHGETYTMAVQP